VSAFFRLTLLICLKPARTYFSRQKFFGFFVFYRYPAFCLLDAYVRVSGLYRLFIAGGDELSVFQPPWVYRLIKSGYNNVEISYQSGKFYEEMLCYRLRAVTT
jgi:hypothetical protein